MTNKKAVGTDYVPVSYPQEKRKQPKKQSIKKTSPKKYWLFQVTPGVGVIAVIFLISLCLVAQHVYINFLGYTISGLNKEITNTQENNSKLKLEIAGLGSLDRIEKVAINELDMTRPEEVHYIFSNATPEQEDTIKIASINPSTDISQASQQEDQVTKKAWLGTVQDFFFNYLTGESNN